MLGKYIIKNKSLVCLYNKLLPIFCILLPKQANKMLYRQTFQKKLDYKNVKDFNEKINWLKVNDYNNNKLVIQCADKYRVRDYIRNNGFSDYLPRLYYIFKSVEEIDWDILPQQFVLKLNRASGMNILCPDKTVANKDEIFREIKSWFSRETGERTCELHYRKAKPVLMCEEYLHCKNDDNVYPVDYKIHCFNGTPYVTLICKDRGGDTKFIFVDNTYRHVPIDVKHQPISIIPEKPSVYEAMLKCAEKLSKPFPFVRIDFYVIDGVPYIGEMTFTPQGGFINYITEEGLLDLGERLKIG